MASGPRLPKAADRTSSLARGLQTVVTESEIIIDNDVTLDGEGRLKVDANGKHRVFSVAAGVTAELRGVTVTGGAALDGGGGIYSMGVLTLTDSTIAGNTATQSGGGIFASGWVKLVNSIVSENAGLGGGGIHIAGSGGAQLTLTHSSVSGNTARGGAGGGGIANYGDVLTLAHSTVAHNAAGTDGAGINSAGAVTLTNSTVSGNTSGRIGGGIYYWGHEALTLTNSTMSGNTAVDGDAIASRAGRIVESKATIIDGDCSVIGGGDAMWVSSVYNLESPGDTCGFDQATDQVNITSAQLNLGPLANNGGPTMTHALLRGSVAINRIPEVMCQLDADQRGEPRPEPGGRLCDVGAYERVAPCESHEDCDDRNDCTVDRCVSPVCDYTELADGTSCEFRGVAGICDAGICKVMCAEVEAIEVQSPLPDERFITGEAVPLVATLRSDFACDGTELTWVSSLDGPLGTGPSLSIKTLSVGTHEVAVDGYGVSATSKVSVFSDLGELYRAPPAEGEIARIREDFYTSRTNGTEADEGLVAL